MYTTKEKEEKEIRKGLVSSEDIEKEKKRKKEEIKKS